MCKRKTIFTRLRFLDEKCSPISIPTAMFAGLLPRALRTLPRLSRHLPLCHSPRPPFNPTNLPHLHHLTLISLPSLTRAMASNSQVTITDAKMKSEQFFVCSLSCPTISLWSDLMRPQLSICLGRGNSFTVTTSPGLPGWFLSKTINTEVDVPCEGMVGWRFCFKPHLSLPQFSDSCSALQELRILPVSGLLLLQPASMTSK